MLIVEDGQVVEGAESYAQASELVVYAAEFGLTIPDTEQAQEALLRRAFVQMNIMPWLGNPVNRDQSGAWPRYNVVRNDYTLPFDVIPAQIKQGQMALSAEIYEDDIDKPELRKGAVTKNRVEGAVEQQYAAAPKYRARPVAVRQSLAQFGDLLQSSGQIKLSRS